MPSPLVDTVKANELLLSYLTPSQKYCWVKHQFFYVQGSKGTIFALWDGYRAVKMAPDGPVTIFNAWVKEQGIPFSDCLLAQKLYLEADEAEFRHLACSTPIANERPFYIRHIRIPGPVQTGQYMDAFYKEAGVKPPRLGLLSRIFGRK